jgi:hypothetical protein
MDHRSARTDVISVLDGLMQDGVIASAKARVRAKPTDRPEIEITVADEVTIVEALRQVRSALEPLGLDLMVVARLGGETGARP